MSNIPKELLNNRRKYIELLMKQGYSIYDIARFFEVSPHTIIKSVRALGLDISTREVKDSIGPFPLDDSFLERRDNILETALKEKDFSATLKEFGLYYLPIAFKESKNIVKYQSNHPIYHLMLQDYSTHDIASQLNMTYQDVKREINLLNIDKDRLKADRKIYKQNKDIIQFIELSSAGFNRKDISRYLNLPENQVECLNNKIKKANILNKDIVVDKEFVIKYAKTLLKEGLNIDEVVEITGLAEHNVSKILKSCKSDKDTKPLSFKYEKRRELIYTMYTQDLMTQQEIADKLGITRATVMSDIKTYKKDHPKEIDKTYLWRQRNLNVSAKMERIDRKQQILLFNRAGMSVYAISKNMGLLPAMVTKYLEEEGYQIESNSISSQKNKYKQAYTLNKEGKSNIEISNILNISENEVFHYIKKGEQLINKISERTEELRLSWQGDSTTVIMGKLGKARNKVLEDQHKTANKLRNDSSFYETVSTKNGDISIEEYEK